MTKLYVDGSKQYTCSVIEEVPKIHEVPASVTTTNQAEYVAVVLGLERAFEEGHSQVEVLSDSQLVVRQLNTLLGRADVRYRIKNKWLVNLARGVLFYVRETFGEKNVSFRWIPREENLAGEVLG